MLFDVKLAKSISSLLSSIVLSISSLLCVFSDLSVNWGNNNCNRVFELSLQPTKLSLTISLLV